MKKFIVWCLFFLVVVPCAAAADRASELEETFVRVARGVGPAVVSVSTVRVQTVGGVRYFGPGGQRDPNMEEFLRQIFGLPPQREITHGGIGSGVIIDRDGYILTNDHVVSGAKHIEVMLSDGRKFRAMVLGSDPRSDIAVLKIQAADLPVAVLGDSDKLRVGQWALAIGNPFGFIVRNPQPSMTTGIISALHRTISHFVDTGNRYYGDLIQTDASINIGNSGGPLVNLKGEVVGINTLIFSTTGGSLGIGFAIPINRVKTILEDLMQGRAVPYGWAGMYAQPVSELMASVWGLPDNDGALIYKVGAGTPAEQAGLRKGDVVRKYNGEPVDGPDALFFLVNRTPPGEKIIVSVLRGGREQNLPLVIGRRPPVISKEIFDDEKTPAAGKPRINVWSGMKVREITKEIAVALKVPPRSGVVIDALEQDAPAYRSGLRRGDIIDEIARKPVKTIDDFNAAITGTKGNTLVHTDKGYVVIEE